MNTTQSSDIEMISRLSANLPGAQREIINRFNPRLFMYFRMRIKGEEHYEDLVQEVFVSFFDAVGKNKIPEDKFIAPFIFGVAKRVMYNYFYKKKRNENIQKKSEDHFEVSYDFEEEERMSNESLNLAIQSYIEKLPVIDKTILKEFYLKENGIGEVAELLGKSRHYISVRKERAIKKIKSEILKKKNLFK